MKEYAQNLAITDEEKALIICKNIVKAVEKTHEVGARSKLLSQKAREAIQTGDKQTMWITLQDYIHKYQKIFTMANGVRLVRVNADYYENVTKEDIVKQLDIVIGLIYLNEAKQCVAKETVKACFKKLLRQSGVFSDREIELLLL